MALVTCDFFSDVLEVGCSMTVVLPQPTEEQIGVEADAIPRTDFPVLYLLHGLSDDHTAWLRYTSVERYAAAAGVAVVMPAVNRSFYANEVNGGRYWDYVADELPEIVGNFFRISQDPAQTYVAGLSMGGYGAMKLALTHPDRFAAAATLSGALDLDELSSRPERVGLFDRIYGKTIPDDADVFKLLDAADVDALPRIHVSTGTEDSPGLVKGNRRFVAALEEKGADVTSDFRPGEHVWQLWDDLLPEVIDWMLHPGVGLVKRALIVVDVQNDFCEGGSLPVAGGAQVAHDIGRLLHRWMEKAPDSPAYDVVVASKDHHVDPGEHWAREPDFVDSWPVHCKVGTDGEAFHPNLDPQPFDAIFLKGEEQAAYSAFEGKSTDGSGLADWLRDHHIDEVDICGLATDHCVRATALDAAAAGFTTSVLIDLCAGVAPDTTETALATMRAAGVTVE